MTEAVGVHELGAGRIAGSQSESPTACVRVWEGFRRSCGDAGVEDRLSQLVQRIVFSYPPGAAECETTRCARYRRCPGVTAHCQ